MGLYWKIVKLFDYTFAETKTRRSVLVCCQRAFWTNMIPKIIKFSLWLVNLRHLPVASRDFGLKASCKSTTFMDSKREFYRNQFLMITGLKLPSWGLTHNDGTTRRPVCELGTRVRMSYYRLEAQNDL